MMNDSGKSDKLIVPKRVANKASVRAGAAERPEGRGLTKGNPSRNPDSGHSARQICHMRGNGYEREPNIPGRYSSIPEVGARCGSSARRDLCGGWPVRAIPTANVHQHPVAQASPPAWERHSPQWPLVQHPDTPCSVGVAVRTCKLKHAPTPYAPAAPQGRPKSPTATADATGPRRPQYPLPLPGGPPPLPPHPENLPGEGPPTVPHSRYDGAVHERARQDTRPC